jgi:hypothetical protein
MTIFAEAYVLKVDLPFSEYWLPLLIGMGVGVCALTMGKLVFGRRKQVAKVESPPTAPAQEFDPFTQGSASEMRKSFRREGNLTEVFIALAGQKQRPSHALVVDRSTGGLGLKCNTEVAPGTRLAVLPVNAPSMTPWVDIEVRSCRNVADGFELGCQFVKTPNWSILLMFG